MSFDLKIEDGDIVFNTSGSPKFVFDDNKLKQDVVKILLTPVGSNRLYPWYGSPLSDKVVGKVLDKKVLDLEIQNAIMYAINNLIELQKLQMKDGQYLSPGEVIAQVKDIIFEPNANDARQLNVLIEIATRRGDIINESFILTV